jgi:aryl-alcohol dehydrogenase-like predicted oxidoreductase
VQYRNLGRTGLKVSTLCLGSMQFGWTADEKTSYKVLNAAYAAGINFIDTANVYSQWVEGNPGGVAETIIGRWIKENKIPREQLVIATKVRGKRGDGVNDEGLSRAHILREVENSLRRLQVETIDLYQTHSYDSSTPIEETLSAMDDLVHQGKVRYIGCSNYPAWRLMQALWASDKLKLQRFDSLQPHYNLVHREEFERELSHVCETYGLGVIPYSPLGGGFLTGKYHRVSEEVKSARRGGVERRYFNERGWSILDALEKMASEKDVTVSQLSLAWLLHQPVITSPIIGPRNIDQLEDNLGAVDVDLSDEEIKLLNEVSDWRH